jgi:osmotically-inducible protein OsmY
MGNTVPIVAPPAALALQSRVQGLITNSSSLQSRSGINVGMVGDTIHLNGNVTDDHERRLAESIVRMTPGVRNVQNNLTVTRLASNQ